MFVLYPYNDAWYSVVFLNREYDFVSGVHTGYQSTNATSAGMTGIFNKVGYYVHTGAAGAYGYKDCIVYVENASSTTDAQYTAMAAFVNPSYMTIQLGSERN